MSEWISVKDRLPEHSNNYLIYHPEYGGCVGYYQSQIGRYGDKFYRYNGEIMLQLGGVTHWMPLPEPPKGE